MSNQTTGQSPASSNLKCCSVIYQKVLTRPVQDREIRSRPPSAKPIAGRVRQNINPTASEAEDVGFKPTRLPNKINIAMRHANLIERDNSAMTYFKKLFPNTPDYVLQDFVYKNYHHAPDQIEPEIVEWLNSLTWTKREITVTIDVFDSFTQSRLKELIGGAANDQRYQAQRDRIASGENINKEPIILTMDGDELELQEGWHRTAESLRQWPEGYKQVAWIGS